jgi:hypothetical protein
MAGNAETELHSYFAKEVELLDQDEDAKVQDQDLQQRLSDWAKRFHFNVDMGATEIVATKKDAALNAEYVPPSRSCALWRTVRLTVSHCARFRTMTTASP